MGSHSGDMALDERRARRKWWVLLAVGACSFGAALDGSIVNTVLPVAARALDAKIDAIQWVVTIFLLVVSGLMLGFGRLGDLRGHKKVFLSGFGIWLGASACCGFAPTVATLVAARAFSGLGAAMIFSNSPAILTHNFPPEERGRALGLQASLTYLGLTVGPTLGGWLTEWLSWRAVFFVHLPFGLVAWLLSFVLIPSDEPRPRRERFDWPGAAAFMVGLSAVLLALNRGHDWGWRSPTIVFLFGGAAALGILFLWRERMTPEPMLDLTLFRQRTFSLCTASAVCNYICVYTVVFLLPFYLIQARGLGPAHAGLLLSAQPLIMVVAAPTAGFLSDRMGARTLSTLGMLILGAGLFALSRLDAQSPMSQVVVALLLAGLGTGTFIAPNNSALMGAAPRGRQGIAAGILATARNTGMMLGIGISGAVFTTVLGDGARRTSFDATAASFAVTAGVAFLGAVLSALIQAAPRRPAPEAPPSR